MSRHRVRGALARPGAVSTARTLLLRCSTARCGAGADPALSALEIGPFSQHPLPRAGDVLGWHARAALTLLVPAMLAIPALCLTVAAQWTGQPMLIPALGREVLLPATIILAGSGILQAVGWTTTAQGPQSLLAPGVLGVLLAAALICCALASRRRSPGARPDRRSASAPPRTH